MPPLPFATTRSPARSLLLPALLAACSSTSAAPPAVDAAHDAAPDAAPAVDLPSIDAPPAPDLPPVDAPAPDAFVSTSTTCSLPVQGELALPSDRVTGTTSGLGRLNARCAGSVGPEHIYTLRLPSPSGVQLSAEASFDTVLMIRRACNDPGSELACNDDRPDGVGAFARAVLDPGEYDVIVDGFGGGFGDYALTLRTWAPVANADCGAALPLAPGAPLTGDALAGGDRGTACLTAAWGPQLYYSVRIPPGRRAVVTATPAGTPAWSAVLRARPGCATNTCFANAASPSAGAPAVLRVDNHAAGPVDYVVSVASATGLTGGAFSLAVALEDAPPLPPHASCAAARALSAGARLADEDLSAAATRLSAHCLPAAQGAVLFYRLPVPPGATGVVTATPRPGWNPVLRALPSCLSFTCLSSADAAGDDLPESIAFTNATAAEASVTVAVGARDASNGGRFDLTAAVNPAPTNTTCSAASAVSHGARLAFQNAAQGADGAPRACLPAATSPALWYRAVVPAGQTLTVRVTPVDGADVAVRVLDACGATSCLASADAGRAGVTEHLSYGNASTSERTVLLAVSGGMFHLEATVDGGYLETSVPTACDALGEGDALPGVNADESMTPAAALPFAVTFFGRPMTAYSASSNGFLQLHASVASAATANVFENVPIPTAAAPNGLVAAFWDDLVPLSGSRVQAHAFGSAPDRRFVLQWAGFAFPRDVRARLTFQVKLFEGSGAVEVHHCELAPGTDAPRATGSSATVGVESPDGAAGRQHSFNDAAALSTTRALRFTPEAP